MIGRLVLLLTLMLALAPAAVAHEHGAVMPMHAAHVASAPAAQHEPVSFHTATAILTAADACATMPCGGTSADACAAICAIACLAVIDDIPANPPLSACPPGIAAPAADLVAITSAPPTPPPRG